MTDTARSVNASDAWFSAAVTGTLTALVNRAAAATNATRKYFATAEMDFDPKLYGLAQCAPDLTPAQCQGCLRNLQNVVVSARFLSGRPPSNSAFVVWCSLRYSVSPIYDGRAMLQTATIGHAHAPFFRSEAHRSRTLNSILFSSKQTVVTLTIKYRQNSSNHIVLIRSKFSPEFQRKGVLL